MGFWERVGGFGPGTPSPGGGSAEGRGEGGGRPAGGRGGGGQPEAGEGGGDGRRPGWGGGGGWPEAGCGEGGEGRVVGRRPGGGGGRGLGEGSGWVASRIVCIDFAKGKKWVGLRGARQTPPGGAGVSLRDRKFLFFYFTKETPPPRPRGDPPT